MTEDSSEKECPYDMDTLSQVLKKLDDSNFISIFFLLIDYCITPATYLEIIAQDKSWKEFCLNSILRYRPKELLIELLRTIKRYDLLKAFNVCHHKFQHYFSLNIMWKSLYEICETIDFENDMKFLEKAFKGVPISDKDPLEVFIVKAYHEKLISKNDLSTLLNDLNKDSQKSKTWAQNEHYFIRQPTVEVPCGLAIIINHKNFSCETNDDLKLDMRKDSHLDVGALEKLWKEFGFETRTYNDDLKAEKVLDLFQKLSDEDLSSYDVFVTCYMSHGNEGVVYASDCQPIPISNLIHFMANKCKSLVNKPKLFFIQACQGTQIQCGNSKPVFSTPSNAYSNFVNTSGTPLFVDVLVAISSIPGFVSFASKGKNSWFIEALIENMQQYGHKQNILDVMVKVNNQVSEKNGCIDGKQLINCKQTVEQKISLRKLLQLKKLCT